MKRLAVTLLVAAVLWFGLKDWAFRTFIDDFPEPAASVDYSTGDNWWIWPETAPGGGWETPWGVDIFAVAPKTEAEIAADGYAWADDSDLAATIEALGLESPVYLPRVRNAQQDISASFQTYVEDRNTLRSVLFLTTEDNLETIKALHSEQIAGTDLQERFGGVILLDGDTATDIAGLACPEYLNSGCVSAIDAAIGKEWLKALLPRRGVLPKAIKLKDQEAAAQSVKGRVSAVSESLDANLPKPAEPLGGFDSMESVDIAPIRRPGDVAPEEDAENSEGEEE